MTTLTETTNLYYITSAIIIGCVHDTTKIWRIWDPESRRVVQCSDVKFDKSQTAHMSCLQNEKDALGLPEEEPIHAEVLAPEENAQSTPLPKGREKVTVLADIAPDSEVATAASKTPDEVVAAPPPPSRTEVRTSQRLLRRSARRQNTTATPTALAAASEDPQSYHEALDSPLR